MSAKIQRRAAQKLKHIRNLLDKASKGKSLNGAWGEIWLCDASELVKYYERVAKGDFKKAYLLQTEVDIGTLDLMDEQITNFLYRRALDCVMDKADQAVKRWPARMKDPSARYPVK